MAGLFEGIDTRTQADILRSRAQEIAREFRERGPTNAPLSMQMMRNAGGMLGSALRKPQLTDQERITTTAVANAKSRFDQWRLSNKDATVEDQGIKGQSFLAEEFLRAGHPAGIQLASSVAQQLQARRQAALEERKLNADIDYTDAKTAETVLGLGKNTGQDIWLPGQKFGDTPIHAWIDENHNAVVNGTMYAPGEYFVTAPVDTTKGQRYRPSDHGISTGTARYLQDYRSSIVAAMDNAVDQAAILQEAVKNGGTLEILNKAGDYTEGAATLVDNIAALGRVIEKATARNEGTTPEEQRLTVAGVQGDLSTEDAARKWAEANGAWINSLEDYMPESVRKTSEARTRWGANMARTGYVIARMEQPGARQISNDAFKNAVQSTAMMSTNPEAFRRVTQDAIEAKVREFRSYLRGFHPEALESVYGPDAMNDFENSYNNWSRVYNQQGFGAAGAPGGGLTNPIPKEQWEDEIAKALAPDEATE